MKNFIIICQGVLTLFGLMICGLFVTNIIGLLPIEGDAHQWLIFSGQNIFAFILPPLLIWKMQFKTSPLKAMGGEYAPTWRWFLIMLLIYFAAMPALNQIVFWNQEMHLPESMSGFEDWCRRMEKLAEDQTSGLLDSTDISTTVMNIFVIGVLTGIGEEFFFRGGLQRILTYCKVNHHVAIWTTAIVFSALHFQFFGFVPRVLLGALFGYLYWWSGNIWINSSAHALNNSLVIISNWCINKGYVSEDFDMLGVNDGGMPTAAIFSTVITSAIIYILYNRGFLRGHRVSPLELSSKPEQDATKSN